MENSRHLIFSDESGWNGKDQFGSIGIVSGTFEGTKKLNDELSHLLRNQNKSELKFKEIKSASRLNLADQFFRTSIKYLRKGSIKIHVLVWNKKDDRHDVVGRCDIENLKRMYYHNLMVTIRHWNVDTTWEFYPDEFSAINWNEDVIKYVKSTSLHKFDDEPRLFLEDVGLRFPKYNWVIEKDSKRFAILQLADLYAGAIRASRTHSEMFSDWFQLRKAFDQPTLFDQPVLPTTSNNLKPKFELLYRLKLEADRYKMGLNLSDSSYFKTFNNSNNWFIWHYEPQGNYDKAPVKRKSIVFSTKNIITTGYKKHKP